MNLVVTCGPAREPVDTTRSLTNHSTGRLGALLAAAFRARGHRVTLLRGEGATFAMADLDPSIRVISFGTNADLERSLTILADEEKIDALFHAAALCDFGVAEIRDAAGAPAPAGKLPSRAEGYSLILKPLPKLIHRLRALFPAAFLAGWKYETEGGREQVVALGLRQLEEGRTDLSVLNGPGYGSGYGLLRPDGTVEEVADATALAAALAAALERRFGG